MKIVTIFWILLAVLCGGYGILIRAIGSGTGFFLVWIALAKTHYKALISSGVKISEWQPGFTHAKIVIADGVEAVAGTINLDYRSLYHHFENAVWMRGTDCIANMEADFQDTLTRCRRVEQTKESIWQGKKLLHLAGILLKFIAPLV